MDEEREKRKAFSSSTTLLWNTFSLSLVLPFFLTQPQKKRLKYLKKFTGFYVQKKKLMFVCVGLFLHS